MRTKWFRICRSGKTVDGREVTPEQIDAMAANYDPALYGARINVEHQPSIMPGSPLAALGDVVAVEARTETDGTRALYAQVDAKPELVQLARNRDKVYWSAEVHPAMPPAGKPYLMGLAVTDRPASLGTEYIRLSARAGTMPAEVRDHLFSEPLEAALPGDLSAGDGASGLVDRVRQLLSGESRKTEARLSGIETALVEFATAFSHLSPSPAPAADPPSQPPATAAGASSASSPPAPAAPLSTTSPSTPPPSTPNDDGLTALTGRFDQLLQTLAALPATAGRPLSAGGTATTPLKTDC